VPRLSPYPRARVPGYSLPAERWLARLLAALKREDRVVPESDLVEPPFMAKAHHFLDENRLLLVVEAGE
jgi:hypothetical protein